jgi:hypothetical protein
MTVSGRGVRLVGSSRPGRLELLLALLAGLLAMHGLSSTAAAATAHHTFAPPAATDHVSAAAGPSHHVPPPVIAVEVVSGQPSAGAAHGSAAPLPPPAGGADPGHQPYDLLQHCLFILCGVTIVALLLTAVGRPCPPSWLREKPRAYVGVLPSCRPPPRGRPRISLCVLRT